MKAYRLTPERGIDGLTMVDLPDPTPGPGEVVVRVRATSLNYRDLLFKLSIVEPDRIDDTLDPSWNCLERYDATTKLLHYTVVPTQPWKVEDHPLGDLWLSEFQTAVAAGAVPRAEVESLVRSGRSRRDLLRVFDAVPSTERARPARNVAEVALEAALDELARCRSRSVRWRARRQLARFSSTLRRLRAAAPPSSRLVRQADRVADYAKRALR